MTGETARRLNEINRRFYATHAEAFADTRRQPWRSWERLLPHLRALRSHPLRVVDAGCGNGRFGRFLADHFPALDYRGIDASAELLAAARRSLGVHGRRLDQVDLVDAPAARSIGAERRDVAAAIGLLHHIPGQARRRDLLAALATCLRPGGLLVVVFWDFAANARLASRRLAWSEAGLDPAELEAGDALLRWGPEGLGTFRYCHHSDEAERRRLLGGLDLTPVAAFRGERSLNLYRILRRRPPVAGPKPSTLSSSSRAARGSTTRIVRIPRARALLRLAPISSRKTACSGSMPSARQTCR